MVPSMETTWANNVQAVEALELVLGLQSRFASELTLLQRNPSEHFGSVPWQRAQGAFGGGNRLVSHDKFFNRASINVSQVQYEDQADKPLDSATAISTIIHPHQPHCPSLHMHISWTTLKSGHSYWRIMADLNPSLPEHARVELFRIALEKLGGAHAAHGLLQGDRYFYIPALQRHRGVAHFYLESFNDQGFDTDLEYARRFGQGVIDTYIQILREVVAENHEISQLDQDRQLAYHTVYFFQVLTLDRGTTSGILVHNENDAGILGSLPAKVDRKLLQTWLNKIDERQKPLLKEYLGCLATQDVCSVEEPEKLALAQAMRRFYQNNPEAKDLLARGDVIPTTTANHTS